MGCGSDFETSNCICDTLLAIAEAQDLVNPEEESHAKGCERAINELSKGQIIEEFRYNTIPIMLTVFNTGKLFEGHGSTRVNGNCYFVESKIFRIDNVDSDTCCATLELLRKKTKKDSHQDDHCFDELEGTDVYITVDLEMFGAVSCLCPVAIHHDCK